MPIMPDKNTVAALMAKKRFDLTAVFPRCATAAATFFSLASAIVGGLTIICRIRFLSERL